MHTGTTTVAALFIRRLHVAEVTSNYRPLLGQKSLHFDDPSTPRRATLFDDDRDLSGAAEREQ